MANRFPCTPRLETGASPVDLIIGSQKMKSSLLQVGRILKSKKREKRRKKEKRNFSSGYRFLIR